MVACIGEGSVRWRNRPHHVDIVLMTIQWFHFRHEKGLVEERSLLRLTSINRLRVSRSVDSMDRFD